jgi:mannose-6-phosphate isomerase-like protein (cupin superfamily)
MPAPEKINLDQKFSLFSDYCSPKIVAQLNSDHVKLVKLKGEFIWHKHDDEDEMFLILHGKMTIQFRDKDMALSPGEMIVIPKGVEHRPLSTEEVSLMLIEPAGTLNTGNVKNSEKTVEALQWI